MLTKILCIFLVLLPGITICQNTLALPEITNYTKHDYNAGTQNWKFVQDEQGIIYVGNNEGMLTYDGSKWNKFILPNESIIRSLAIGKDHKIYVGAQGELGYFEPNQNGFLLYHSLNSFIPNNQLDFADVWNIAMVDDKVFFHSNKRIFEWNNGKMVIYPGYNWDHLGYANGILVANELKQGLLKYDKGLWVPFTETGKELAPLHMIGFVSLNKDTALVVTRKNGLFYCSNNQLTPFVSPDIARISEKIMAQAVMLNPDNIAISTNLDGCFVINKQGQLVQRLSKQDGLQNNNIITMFLDNRANLWLGLDNGIDFVAYNNAIKHIYPDNQEHSSGYAAIVHHGSLYLGTANGLYRAPLNNATDLGRVRGNFTLIPNARGQVWNLSEVNDKLLMGHTDGSFVIEEDRSIPLDVSSGFWVFLPLENILPSGIMLAGTYNGINIYHYADGKFSNPSIHSHFESARFIAMDNNVAWVAHPYKGLYKVTDLHTNPQYKVYEDKKNVLSNNRNFIFKVKGRVILASDKGIFEYDAARDDFFPSKLFASYFTKTGLRYLKEDESGNVWFIEGSQLGVIDFSGKKPQKIYIPELNNKLVYDFDFIYPYNSKNILVTGEQGFYLINLDQYKSISYKTPLLISSVKAISDHDSSLFAGFKYTATNNAENVNSHISSLPYQWNSIQFEFSSPLYGKQASVEYSYMIDGYDKGWSAWSGRREKTYNALPPGSYTFKVRARSYPGDVPVVKAYSFSVLPPWYRTNWAYVSYLAMFGLLLFAGYRLQQREFRKQQQKHEEEQKHLQYLHQLELEKNESEIIRLKNEKLEAELQLKNKELTSTTINLVQKGEVLHKIKDEFQRMKKSGSDNEKPEDYKKIIKMLEPEKVKKDWEQFALHFNQVHDDFLVAIKEEFPTLTPNEIKLCAYLRLNLSSKEIGQIMNITIKSVELSRYRLRKKLQLPTDANLSNFLLSFHTEHKNANQVIETGAKEG